MDDYSFLNELIQPTINVPRAALCYARSLTYPTLDVDGYMEQFDLLAEAARPYVADGKTLADRVDALSDFLFDQVGFRGNREDYYDPQNSFLNRVLDRKCGIPITLGLVYITVARRLRLNAYGINLPGHFIVGVYQDGVEVLVDPFNAGLRLSGRDCVRLVKESTGREVPFQQKWLRPIAPGDMLARMLTNLCHAYIQREDWRSAIPVMQHLLQVQPETDFHLRDLGYVYLYSGSLRLSAQYLEAYLRRAPDAPDFENVRTSLQIVAGRLALWN